MVRQAPWMMVIVLVAALACAPAAHSGVLVSLGDSYSSGEGSRNDTHPGWDFPTGGKCHRGPNAWPRLLGVPAGYHFACSGAKLPDLLARGRAGAPAPDDVSQLARLAAIDPNADIDAVLITIGGNDIDFAGIIKRCVIKDCLRDQNDTARKLADLKPKLVAAYDQLADATWGPIVVVGYPDLIPGTGKPLTHCGWMTDLEKVRVRSLEADLDDTLREAAADADVDYISIRDALAGHELCTPKNQSWINSVKSPFHGSGQGHPRARGQRAMADAVRSRLQRLVAPALMSGLPPRSWRAE